MHADSKKHRSFLAVLFAAGDAKRYALYKQRGMESGMDTKDYWYAAGIVLTFLIGVWNLRQSWLGTRKANFINTVTSQRVIWIEQLRQDISAFSGLTHTWCFSELEGRPGEHEVLKELDRLRHVIQLRLNPDGTYDRKITALIKQIPELTHESKRDQLKAKLNELTEETQALLKEEWEKVKCEAKYGDINEKPCRRA